MTDSIEEKVAGVIKIKRANMKIICCLLRGCG